MIHNSHYLYLIHRLSSAFESQVKWPAPMNVHGKGFWTEHYTANGRLYYYNMKLNESYWGQPAIGDLPDTLPPIDKTIHYIDEATAVNVTNTNNPLKR